MLRLSVGGAVVQRERAGLRAQIGEDGGDAAVNEALVGEPELAEDDRDVLLDGFDRDVKLGRDSPVGQPVGDLFQHVDLAHGQIVDDDAVMAAHEGVDDAGVQHGLASAHLAEGTEHGVDAGEPFVKEVGEPRCAAPQQFEGKTVASVASRRLCGGATP